MNLIKYMPTKYKKKCIECHSPLIKDIRTHEIFCSNCGMIFIDFSPMTRELLDYGVKLDYKIKNKQRQTN